jgi:hypothetical protein
MADDQEQADRWRELAEQLGLDGQVQGKQSRPDSSQDGLDSHARPEADAPPESPPLTEPNGTSGDQEPRTKGRRGRRSGRGKGKSSPHAAADSADKDRSDPAAKSDDRLTNPRKARGRRNNKAALNNQAAPSSANTSSPDDDDDMDDISDWNVPTWTELIDSLYRPDR